MLQEKEKSDETESTSITTLLLIDKNEDNLRLNTEILNKNGYSVLSTNSLNEARLYLSGSIKPDLVIAEIETVSKNDFELLDAFNNLYKVPYALIGDTSKIESISIIIKMGAVNLITYPYSHFQLISYVNYSLMFANQLINIRKQELQIQEVLDLDRIINTAVGITMVKHQISRDDAFKLLRKNARDQRLKLANMCTEIVNAVNSLNRNMPDLYRCEQKLTCKLK